jgi:ferritin-like metal-binding protein YciE
MLGKSNIKKLLKQNLAQEEATDKSLSELAESLVNYEALSR